MHSSLPDEFLAAGLLATGFVHTVTSPVEDARTCACGHIHARARNTRVHAREHKSARTRTCRHVHVNKHTHVNAQNDVHETRISIH
jgi:hypothetical protein